MRGSSGGREIWQYADIAWPAKIFCASSPMHERERTSIGCKSYLSSHMMYIIGRVEVSPPSCETGLIFIYTYIVYSVSQDTVMFLRASFSLPPLDISRALCACIMYIRTY